jgi:ankyrin repeat protein
MKRLELGIEFYIATFIAMICAIILLFVSYQTSIIDDACAAIRSGDVEQAKIHAEKALDINAIGSDDSTMLMTACQSGNYDMIRYLLSKGADVNHSPKGSLTPIELFCIYGYESGEASLQLLLDANVKQHNYTIKPAVFYLAENFYWMTDEQKKIATEEAILMLQYGAPLSHENTSILHLAAKSDMEDLFYTVVHTTEGLSLLRIKDYDGNTPWDVAVKSGAIKVQRVIRNLENEYREEQGGGNEDILQPIDPPTSTFPVELPTLPPNEEEFFPDDI